MIKFVYDTPVTSEDICNLTKDRQKLNDAVTRGERVVLYGRRNTGKTSLLMHSVMPAFVAKNPQGFAIYADLLGVKSLNDISRRLRKAYEFTAKKSAPLMSALQSAANLVKGIRPTLTFGDFGSPEFSLSFDTDSGEDEIDLLFRFFAKIAESRPLLLIIDEFQDIALIEQAEALIRSALQMLPSTVPVVLSGSKKHIMSKIFGRPKAPLAGWGYDLQISSIPAEEYWPYAQERLEPHGFKISLETTKYLLDLVSEIPEAANIICHTISKNDSKGEITKKIISETFDQVADERRGRYEEQLLRYSREEQLLLIALARYQPITAPQSKDFLKRIPSLSSSGVRKLLSRFEDEAIVYREKEGVVLADPIMRRYLTLFH